MTPYAQMIAQRIRPEAQATFSYEYQRYAKDPNIALLLTLLFGIVGGESYYLGNYVRGILMAIALFTGIGLLVTFPMWIVRCFTIVGECESYNDWMAYVLAWRYGSYDGQSTGPAMPPQPPQPQQANRMPREIGGLPMPVRVR